jgi:sec-independent protein translocase protein TatA
MFAAGNFGSPTQLLIIAVIILLLFGGKRLRSLGSDIGQAIKGFKNSMSNDDKNKEEEPQKLEQQNQSQPVKQTEKTEHKE